MIIFGQREGKKKNYEQWIDKCPNCHNMAKLESYETTRYFHIYYIPLIPLGKKKIISLCPICEYGTEISLKKWEAAKQEDLQKAKAQFDQDSSAENAIALYEVILRYNTIEEATKFGEVIKERFKDSPLIKDYFSDYDEATDMSGKTVEDLQKTIDNDPNNKDALYQLGWKKYDAGNFEEAYELLMKTEPVKVRSDIYYLINLTSKLEIAPAYEVLKYLHREHGELIEYNKTIQNLIRKCESNLSIQKDQSIASTSLRKKRVRDLIIGVSAAVLVFSFIFIYYINQRNNQQVFIVNGNHFDTQLTIADEVEVTVPAFSKSTIELACGIHEVTIQTPNGQSSVNIEIDGSVWEIYFERKTFVLNPLGAAIILEEDIIYTNDPLEAAGPYHIYMEEEFMTFTGVDYAFEPIPEEIESSSYSSRIIKKYVDYYEFEPYINAQIMMTLDDQVTNDQVLGYIERTIESGIESENLLWLYDSAATLYDQEKRAFDFLESQRD